MVELYAGLVPRFENIFELALFPFEPAKLPFEVIQKMC
jgi:hypothetical protein